MNMPFVPLVVPLVVESVSSFVVGLLLWTLLEYVLHRFGGHQRAFGAAVSREHLNHHARPDTFSTLARKAMLAVPVLTTLFVLVALCAGLVTAVALTAGTSAGWCFYEHLHRATHVRPPRNAYGAWARKHHLFHHFASPRKNHGVTTPLWDWVFRTLEVPEVIVVPRRQVHAFAWLLDDEGELASRFSAGYRLG
ncbi:MAG: sterol desaturase family protein [Deltaproteobacteria bacterium]|nr:sterol desaturase family protein [Deltaproteobacteria bacterium]